MMRSLLIVPVLAMCAAPLVALESLEQAWNHRPARALQLFDMPDKRLPVYGQLLDDSGPRTTEQMFGAGASLSLDTNALGLGFNGFFDFYFTPWIAAASHVGVSYGFLGRQYQEGGTGMGFHVALGARFTFDLPDWEWSRWLRPWVAFYPVGFQLFSASEDFDPPGSDDEGTFKYSDIYFHMMGGGGADFYLTSLIGLGVGVYFYGSFGGSRHKQDGATIRTNGLFGMYFEYARVTLRF
ncbi:MAG: hypothetical protein IT464_00480 [Planctomycetes bacterium]|nr:hypothetical protein [Planctomycetota bacterium]